MATKKSVRKGKPVRRPITVCTRFLEKVDRTPKTLPEGKLCAVAGLPRNQLSRWRQAEKPRPIYLWQAFMLAKALGISLDYLADDERDDPETIDRPEWAELHAMVRRLGIQEVLDRVALKPRPGPGSEPTTRWVTEAPPTLIGPVEGKATTAGPIPPAELPRPKRSRLRRLGNQGGADQD